MRKPHLDIAQVWGFNFSLETFILLLVSQDKDEPGLRSFPQTVQAFQLLVSLPVYRGQLSHHTGQQHSPTPHSLETTQDGHPGPSERAPWAIRTGAAGLHDRYPESSEWAPWAIRTLALGVWALCSLFVSAPKDAPLSLPHTQQKYSTAALGVALLSFEIQWRKPEVNPTVLTTCVHFKYNLQTRKGLFL